MVAQGLRPSPIGASRPKRVAARRIGWLVAAVIGLALLGYAAICGYMALTLTRPDRQPFLHSPQEFGLAYEDVEFASRIDRLALKGWLLAADPQARPQRRPVIMVHGKGTDREAGPGEGILGIAAPLTRAGYQVLTFDLRGSGQSAGERFTLGAQEVRDVGGAIDYLQSHNLAPDGVDLVGFSMGGSTALLAADGEPRVRAVVEDSAFADLGELLEVQVPKVSGLPGFFTPGMVLAARPLIGVDLYSIRPIDVMPRLAATHVPVLVIHGEADSYVPPINGRRLAVSYGPGVETYFIPGAGHVEGRLTATAEYDARLRAFLDRTAASIKQSAFAPGLPARP